MKKTKLDLKKYTVSKLNNLSQINGGNDGDTQTETLDKTGRQPTKLPTKLPTELQTK